MTKVSPYFVSCTFRTSWHIMALKMIHKSHDILIYRLGCPKSKKNKIVASLSPCPSSQVNSFDLDQHHLVTVTAIVYKTSFQWCGSNEPSIYSICLLFITSIYWSDSVLHHKSSPQEIGHRQISIRFLPSSTDRPSARCRTAAAPGSAAGPAGSFAPVACRLDTCNSQQIHEKWAVLQYEIKRRLVSLMFFFSMDNKWIYDVSGINGLNLCFPKVAQVPWELNRGNTASERPSVWMHPVLLSREAWNQAQAWEPLPDPDPQGKIAWKRHEQISINVGYTSSLYIYNNLWSIIIYRYMIIIYYHQ